jgi:hypothetical protein
VPHRGQPHRPHQRADPPRAPGGREEQPERRRRELVERVAVGQHQSPDPGRVRVDDELAERASGVVAGQRHVGQVQRRQEVQHEPGHAARADVGVRLEGFRMSADRQVRGIGPDAAFGERAGGAIPQLAVDQDAVQEHDRRQRTARRSGDAVVDTSLGKVDRGHARPPRGTALTLPFPR